MKAYLKENWTALLLCLSVGMALGYSLDRMCDRRFHMWMLESSKFRGSIVDQLKQNLTLDDGQTREMDKVVEKMQARYAGLTEERNAKRDAIIREAIGDCKAFLSPNQQAKLDDLYQRAKTWYEERRRKRMESDDR